MTSPSIVRSTAEAQASDAGWAPAACEARRHGEPLTTTCIITAYNYGEFIADALESALWQSAAFDEIIVIDDASTDNTPEIVATYCVRNPRVRLLRLETNSGQLAAFERGMLDARGDILFFLDADDALHREYVCRAIQIYRDRPDCDFVYCRERVFRGELPSFLREAIPANDGRLRPIDMGLTLVRTVLRKSYVGGPTSCNSMRRSLARKLLPLPLHDDWRTRADDCLVFGASLAAARKIKLPEELVAYRIHSSNAFAGNAAVGEPARFLRRQIALARLFRLFMRRFEIGSCVRQLAHLEFKTIEKPDFRTFVEYLGYVVRHGACETSRFRGMAVAAKSYWRSRKLR